MFFFCFMFFFGCCFIKFIDRIYCKVWKNVFGIVFEMFVNSCVLVFCFMNLLLVDGYLMFEGIFGLINIVFFIFCICNNVD